MSKYVQSIREILSSEDGNEAKMKKISELENTDTDTLFATQVKRQSSVTRDYEDESDLEFEDTCARMIMSINVLTLGWMEAEGYSLQGELGASYAQLLSNGEYAFRKVTKQIYASEIKNATRIFDEWSSDQPEFRRFQDMDNDKTYDAHKKFNTYLKYYIKPEGIPLYSLEDFDFEQDSDRKF